MRVTSMPNASGRPRYERNSRCSYRCASPCSAESCVNAPLCTATSTVASGTAWFSTTMTSSPLPSRVWWMKRARGDCWARTGVVEATSASAKASSEAAMRDGMIIRGNAPHRATVGVFNVKRPRRGGNGASAQPVQPATSDPPALQPPRDRGEQHVRPERRDCGRPIARRRRAEEHDRLDGEHHHAEHRYAVPAEAGRRCGGAEIEEHATE